jgi:hypothetical protein
MLIEVTLYFISFIFTFISKQPISLVKKRTITFKFALSLSRSSSVSTVSGYGLDYRAIEVRSLAGAEEIPSSLCVQTGSGAHPASCPMGTGDLFPGGKSAAGT